MEELDKSKTNEDSKSGAEPTEEAPATPIEADRSLSTKVETHRTMPSLVRLLGWILAVIIIAVLLVFAARWIYHKTHHAVNVTPATSQKRPDSSSPSKTSGTAPTSGASGNSSSSTSSSSPGTNSSSNSSTQLTNTGPGNVVAVFAVSSLAAAGLHFVINLRKQARS
jgi:hypothetical protein